MKFGALLTTSLLAAPAVAAPKSTLLDRVRARALARDSTPADAVIQGPNLVSGGDPNIKYSTNWAGAAREQPPPDATYSSISATFTVPNPTASTGGDGTSAASSWIGIDGDTYQSTILQAGVDATVQNGEKSYNPWYEWYPDYAHYFDLEVTAGDVIVAQVEASSPSEGVAILENQSNGQSSTKTVSAPNPSATLAGQNAEWIVEDFQSGGDMVGLVDFGQVTFTGAEAKAGGSSYGVSDAQLMEIKQDGTVHTDVHTEGDSTLVVQYV